MEFLASATILQLDGTGPVAVFNLYNKLIGLIQNDINSGNLGNIGAVINANINNLRNAIKSLPSGLAAIFQNAANLIVQLPTVTAVPEKFNGLIDQINNELQQAVLTITTGKSFFHICWKSRIFALPNLEVNFVNTIEKFRIKWWMHFSNLVTGSDGTGAVSGDGQSKTHSSIYKI